MRFAFGVLVMLLVWAVLAAPAWESLGPQDTGMFVFRFIGALAVAFALGGWLEG